jgi:predicted nucleic acid-binding protein
MVVFDATYLSLLLYPTARPPLDPATSKPVQKAKERIEHLVETLSKQGKKIVIPTPALSELLAVARKPHEVLAEINSSRWFVIHPFDQRAAIECADLVRAAVSAGRKKGASSTWAKAKFDYQIIAIAMVAGAQIIYSDDRDISQHLREGRIKVTKISELPLPPPRQMPLDYEAE